MNNLFVLLTILFTAFFLSSCARDPNTGMNGLQRMGYAMGGTLPEMEEQGLEQQKFEIENQKRATLKKLASDPNFLKLSPDQRAVKIMAITGDPSAVISATSPVKKEKVKDATEGSIVRGVAAGQGSNQQVYSPSECIGPIIMGECKGTIVPQGGYHQTCYGQMLDGQCTGPMF